MVCYGAIMVWRKGETFSERLLRVESIELTNIRMAFIAIITWN